MTFWSRKTEIIYFFYYNFEKYFLLTVEVSSWDIMINILFCIAQTKQSHSDWESLEGVLCTWLDMLTLEWTISVTTQLPCRWEIARKENICSIHLVKLYYPYLFSLIFPLLSTHIFQQAKFTAFNASAIGKDWVICMYFLFYSQWRKSDKPSLSLPDSKIISLYSEVADF